MGDFLISASELKSVVGTSGAPLVIDVRNGETRSHSGRQIATASWHDPTTVGRWSTQLGAGTRVICYCEHGRASSQSVAAVRRERSIAARVLQGGYDAWVQASGMTVRLEAFPSGADTLPTRWVTRVRPKIDRIACPWLIRRFIDPEAELLYVDPAAVTAVASLTGATSYDVAGAKLTHRGEACSFDAFIEDFGLSDAALDQLARIVRGADTGRLDIAPEAAGLLAVSLGISRLTDGDDRAALELGFGVYDALYAWARYAASEPHGQLPARA